MPASWRRTLTRGELSGLVFVVALGDIGGIGKPAGIADSESCQVISELHTIAARLGESVLADGSTGCLQCSPGSRDRLRWLRVGTKVHAPDRARIADADLQDPPFPERRLDQARAAKQRMMQRGLIGSIRLPAPGFPLEGPGR